MRFCSLILLMFLPFLLLGQEQFVSFLPEKSHWQNEQYPNEIWLAFEVQDLYHIQADASQIEDEFLIATELRLEYVDICELDYPIAGKMILDGSEIAVFDGQFAVRIMVENGAELTGEGQISGTLYYQTCDDRKCFFPRELSFVL